MGEREPRLFFFKPKAVQSFAYEAGLIYLQSAQVLALHKTLSLTTDLPVVGALQKSLTVAIKAVMKDRLEWTPLFEKRCQDCFGQTLGQIYSAEVLGPREVIPHLETLLAALPKFEELRGQPRVEKRLRATSAQLPGYQGTVVDISLTGLALFVDGPLSRGLQVELEVDFEDQRSRRLTLKGTVCWCRAEAGGPYKAGVRFEGLAPHVQWDLKELVGVLLSQEYGVITDERYHMRD